MVEIRIAVPLRFCVCSSIYSEGSARELRGSSWGGVEYILYVDLELCVKQLFRHALMLKVLICSRNILCQNLDTQVPSKIGIVCVHI